MISKSKLQDVVDRRMYVLVSSKDEWYDLMDTCKEMGFNWRSGLDALRPSDFSNQMDMLDHHGRMLVGFGINSGEALGRMSRTSSLLGRDYILLRDLYEHADIPLEDVRADLEVMLN